MQKELTAHMITKFKRDASAWRFLLENQLDKFKLSEAISQKTFYELILHNVEGEDYSCRATAKAYGEVALKLFGEDLQEDFLDQVYHYTLSKAFPDAVTETFHKYSKPVYEVYLKLMDVVNLYQQSSEDQTFMSVYPMLLLSDDEIRALDQPEEYRRFKAAFEKQNIYTMMKLNYEVTGHSTIEHILGVHHLAMHLGRSLLQKGLPVDLGRVSGAAAGHDIGKFGCRPEESHKIAYYHYYYTDVWFSSLDIQYIKNVAVYHSTWDLEIESLSIESLILIYSDFCVKRSKETPGLFKMKFLDVDTSFQVILDKLDNVDQKKQKRYERVYQKLKNFGAFMEELGIETVIPNYTGQALPEVGQRDKMRYTSSLDVGASVVDNLKFIAIDKSVRMMHRLRHAEALNEIIQEALGEKDIYFFRRYIFIFEEYSTYLTPHQKMITIQFLLGYIMHLEEDIRKECSHLIGKLLAFYDENYTKELPERAEVSYTIETKFNKLRELLDDFLFGETRLIKAKKNRQITSYIEIIKSLYTYVDADFAMSMTKLLISLFKMEVDRYGQRFLIQVIHEMPFQIMAPEDQATLVDFLLDCLTLDTEMRLLAAYELRYLHMTFGDLLMDLLKTNRSDLMVYFNKERSLSERFLLQTIEEAFGREVALVLNKSSSDMFLANLKTATYKTVKQAQIEMLFYHCIDESAVEKFYTAMHYCNIIKVSEYESVRNLAGTYLVALFPKLSTEHKNDIVIELIRALEIEGYGFTQYIPKYLGQLIPTLPDKEYFEIYDDLEYKISNAGANVRILILDTMGTMIETWLQTKKYDRVQTLLGLIFKGFHSGHKLVTQIALNVLSKKVLGNEMIGLIDRFEVFRMIYRKLNNFLLDVHVSELDLLNYSAGMHYVYHFITDYEFYEGAMDFTHRDKVAFYSGTFDPFSLGQKAAAVDSVGLDMDVYIAISEYHWRRRTQPSLVRKQIVEMTIADQFGVYCFPQDIPINLNRQEDIRKLHEIFNDKDIYIVIGEEALIHDPLYVDTNHSIYDFSHIIYRRESIYYSEKDRSLIDDHISKIKGEVKLRTLENELEMIDVEQIRRNINNNWDGFNVIDDLATRYINSHNLYKNEPQFKSIVPITPVRLEISRLENYDQLEDLCEQFGLDEKHVRNLAKGTYGGDIQSDLILKREILTVIDESDNRVIGFSIFAKASPKHLFDEIKCLTILEEIASRRYNKILVVDYVMMKPVQALHALDQIVVTETLMHAVTLGYHYAVVKWLEHGDIQPDIHGVLLRSGFVEQTCNYTNKTIFGVDMTEPVVLNLDGTTRMKADFRQNHDVREQIKMVRSNLQHAIVNLYPGNLVLSFDRSMLYNHLIRKITDRNQVPLDKGDLLGSSMCVPYGDIFKRWLLPNTVTKAFHTERCYNTSLAFYDVEAYPGYLSIENQTQILKSFDRPVILVDDILDKGKRLEAFEQPLREAEVKIDQVIVGIMSARGKSKFNNKGLDVAAAYYISEIKVWFNEADLYPFIGGDSIKRPSSMQNIGLVSVNLMLPFTYPKYIKEVSKLKLYELSMVCLENAITILEVIEKLYLELNGRSLSLEGLREVMIIPRLPDIGAHIHYDVYQSPSTFLRNELDRLEKMKLAFED